MHNPCASDPDSEGEEEQSENTIRFLKKKAQEANNRHSLTCQTLKAKTAEFESQTKEIREGRDRALRNEESARRELNAAKEANEELMRDRDRVRDQRNPQRIDAGEDPADGERISREIGTQVEERWREKSGQLLQAVDEKARAKGPTIPELPFGRDRKNGWYANKEEVVERKGREDRMSREQLASEAHFWEEKVDPSTENIFYQHKETGELFASTPRAIRSKRELLFENSKNKKNYDAAQKRISRFELITEHRLLITGIRKDVKHIKKAAEFVSEQAEIKDSKMNGDDESTVISAMSRGSGSTFKTGTGEPEGGTLCD